MTFISDHWRGRLAETMTLI